VIKGTVILIAACLVIPCLRRRSAAERHALWTAALVAASAQPLLTGWLPAWEPAWARRAAETWPAAFDGGRALGAGDVVIRATGVEAAPWTLLDALPWLWGAMSVAMLGALAVQAMRMRRLAASGVPAGPRHVAIARQVAVQLGLGAPRVTRSDRVAIPLAWGVWRAHLLLPRAADGWSDERVWAVCAHEMAHVSRGDWLAHLLAEVVCRIYWFHPLFWLARSRVSREGEVAADDVVLRLGASGADYASHLLEIARGARPNADLSPTVAMARPSGLERRIAAILNDVANRTRVSRSRALAIVAAAILVAASLAALSASTPPAIQIRTSNLPAVDDAVARELAGEGSDPVRDIRVLDPVAGDVAPSIAEYTTPPLYSDDARRAGVEGVVRIRAHVDASGQVRDPRVTAGLGAGLDQNALVALRQWRFRPGLRDGRAVPMDVELEVGFTLRNDAINAQIANDMVALVGPGVTPPQAVRVADVPSRRTGTTGTVVLDVVLLEDGSPRIVRILRSVGAVEDELAVRVFEQWRFSPALKDGQPIKVRMNAEVRFHG
jgi:TonB family protein